MPWRYSQLTGELRDSRGVTFGFGFAGRGSGLNNPAAQAVHEFGPLPAGFYDLTAWRDSMDGLGLCVIELTPRDVTTMFGRSGFFIHGSRSLLNSGLANFLASSHGCIVIGDCSGRAKIWASGDRVLEVVPSFQTAAPAVVGS